MTDSAPFYDIIIVGAGIVGSCTALSIAQQAHSATLKIALLEASSGHTELDQDTFDPRVVALSLASQQILEQLNVWPNIAHYRACPYTKMKIWDAEGTAHVDFDSAQLRTDRLGTIVENSVIVKALNKEIAQMSNIYQLNSVKIDTLVLPETNASPHAPSKTYVTTHEGQTLSCSLLIAADGAQSTLRTLADIPIREWSYQQTAVVCTVKTQRSHQFCAWQRFMQTGPLAFLPLSKDGCDSDHSSIVWSLDNEASQHIMRLDDAAFCLELERAFEHRLGRVVSAQKRTAIPLTQRHALNYFKEGLALVGDAAHTIHPLAGQGVNLGLYDTQQLAQEIDRACQRDVPLSHPSILKRYERQRKPHNLAAMASMEGFKRLFANDDLAIRWLRNCGMREFNKHTWFKKIVSQAATGQINP